MLMCFRQCFHVPNGSPQYFENPAYFVDRGGGGNPPSFSVFRINPVDMILSNERITKVLVRRLVCTFVVCNPPKAGFTGRGSYVRSRCGVMDEALSPCKPEQVSIETKIDLVDIPPETKFEFKYEY